MLPNAWAHAKAQADCKRSTWHCQHIEVTTNRNYLPVKTLPDLPYSEDYLELLDDINEDKIMYEDIGSQLTSTEEHYAKILLEGISVKRENQMVKQKVVSPELSRGCMTYHARNQLVQTVSMAYDYDYSHLRLMDYRLREFTMHVASR